MTYGDLKKKLDTLNEEQLNQDLTIVDLTDQETYAITDFVSDWNSEERYELGLDIVDGVLDDKHPYFTFA